MKFVPIIGIDNHEKYVTLGSRMLLHEDTKSYTRLLNAFMTAFSHEPTMIVTDQDGAMKRAIESVFKKAKHKLCMWYNMKFVPIIGIDNHEKYVTLGSRMLLHEDTKSYTRLLNAFMAVFSHEPTMIVTDQDGAMKRAIETVFKKAKHKLCMLTNEANFLVDDSLFLLSKDEGKMGTYVENLKILLNEVKADMPNPLQEIHEIVNLMRFRVNHYGSHLIHSHEIHSESHEIHSESHEIETHVIHSESYVIHV
nr:hypothetical protein [Tanacetum cinerariifolium]